MSGSVVAARTWASSSVIGVGGGICSGVNVPECPPAAEACTARASTPASAAAFASAAEVTVCTSEHATGA